MYDTKIFESALSRVSKVREEKRGVPTTRFTVITNPREATSSLLRSVEHTNDACILR